MNKNYRKFNRNKESLIKSKLRESGTTAYKKFGQNFLMDQEYKNFMINGLDLKKGDFIIEIGPGMGALTELLMTNDKLRIEGTSDINYLGIEIDVEKIAYLTRTFPNINIQNISIMDFDTEDFTKKNNIKSYKIIGSLPFNISKQIIQKFSEWDKRPDKAVFMVQKEVGEDYVGREKSGSRFLSIFLSQFWEVEDSQIIPAKAFYPAPKVDGMSMILRAKNSKRDEKFIKFVKRGFSSPRKKLGNILNLEKDNKYYDKRPHELNESDWKILYKDINELV